MSVEVYSECQIRLIPNDNRYEGRRLFSDRCLIELRQHDVGEYSLRAIDFNNNRTEIFNIPLVRRAQYIFGAAENQADRFDTINGQYELLLNKKGREQFHQILRTCINEFLIIRDEPLTDPFRRGNQQKSNTLLAELAQHADEAFYRNDEPFECITCMETIAKGDGIRFRHCLHPCCKQCLLQLIETSSEPTVKCPHDDCPMLIEERELRAVVRDMKADEKLVDRLLDTGMRFAESRNKTVHCLSADCPGWWFVEPEEANSLIHCKTCKRWNCLACKAIHEGQTCKEYQEMKLKEANEGNLRKDNDFLEELINKKEVMYCPGCRALIQKISGCDWIQCSQCKLEICWPTRGPRWGPGGRGDTSGGCQCRVNGKLCVPNCGNCH